MAICKLHVVICMSAEVKINCFGKKNQTSEPSSWWQTKVFAIVSGHYHKSLPTPKVIVLLVDCQGNRSPQESSHVRSRAVDKILHQLIHSDIILISQ